MTTSIRLSRPSPNTPWGFRIHGGKDFNQPLIILKVTGGSVAEQCGLSPGDAILQINNRDALHLKHKEAQDLILYGGNFLDFVVQKGATSTWAPKVTPLGQLNPRQPAFTQTSLKKEHGPGYVPRPGINSNAKPFESYQGGQALVNKQFNSPINLYSEQNLAETLSAQAEVLAGGAIGVNFKKNEKEYKYEDSEVYKMLKQIENEPPRPPQQQQEHNDEDHGRSIPITPYCSSSQKSPVQPSPNLPSQHSLLKSVQAPYAKPETTPGGHNPNVCADCERLIVGVFVRIKDKNLHVECFKCTTCGTSLKNIGYFNINNKLYCDVHAKSVAKVNAPPGLEPYATFPSDGPTGDGLLQVYKEDENLSLYSQNTAEHFQAGDYEEEMMTSTSGGGGGKSVCRSIPINKPFNYTTGTGTTGSHPTIDTTTANLTPLPYHHSPTQTHHVTAPKSPNKTQSLFSSSGGGTGGGSSKVYESKSSSSFSETITKSGGAGSKFVWPPQRNEDEVMMGSELGPGPIQQQSSSYSASDSSYSTFGGTGVAVPPSGGITIPITPYAPIQAPSTFAAPTYASFGGSANYKPVAPPKPAYSQQHAPYRSPTALLTTTGKTGTSYVPPPFGGSGSLSPNYGGGGGLQAGPPTTARGKGQFGRGILPTRGKGILTQPGPRVAICASCQRQIRGPFVSAGGGKIYCPEHFKCSTPSCRRPLIDIGFVEERGGLYCEYCWESYLAPECSKCRRRIKNECLNAIGQHFHPTCFLCAHCGSTFNNNPFYLEDGRPYCERDWNEMFTTKCYGCGFTIEAGDRWVEALGNNYHSQCFNCSACKKNLEGQSFLAKGGRPFCKQHGR